MEVYGKTITGLGPVSVFLSQFHTVVSLLDGIVRSNSMVREMEQPPLDTAQTIQEVIKLDSE